MINTEWMILISDLLLRLAQLKHIWLKVRHKSEGYIRSEDTSWKCDMAESRCVSHSQSECQSLPKGDLSSGSSSSNLFPKVAVFGAMRLGFPCGCDAEVASKKDQGIVRTPPCYFRM